MTAAPSRIISEQPEGEAVLYSRSGQAIFSLMDVFIGEQTDLVKVVYAPDGETVYFQNLVYRLDEYFSEYWTPGKLSDDGTQITVDMGQVVCYDDYNSLDISLVFGSTIPDEALMEHVRFVPDPSVTQAVFTVDPETHVLTLQNTEGEMYNGTGYQGWEATGLGAVLSDGTWAGFMSWNTVLTPMTEAKPAVPCDPVQLAYENGSEWEKANFHFHIMPFDVDGNRLYEENYSYRIYMDDDQLFTFKADEYGPGGIFADGDLTEIPLNYSDYMNIISWDGTRVYFFQNNTDEARLFDRRIGVQAVYTVDGVSNASNIIYMSVMRVNGVVVDLAGKPVPNVQVSFSVKPLNNPAGQRTAGTVPVYVTTDENGEFATELNAFVDYQVSYLVDWQSVLDSELYTEEDDINLGEIVLPIGNSAISDVKAGTADDDIYYDLMGRKFRGDNLPAGIYIHGGKKVLVK